MLMKDYKVYQNDLKKVEALKQKAMNKKEVALKKINERYELEVLKAEEILEKYSDEQVKTFKKLESLESGYDQS